VKIAVIGSGIAGLGAAWLLSRQHDVTVYEKNDYAGGHSNTVEAPTRNGPVPVDTGFIVFNEKTYPNLLGLFAALEVPVKKTDMSFAVSIDGGRLEYGGSTVGDVFAQRRNAFSPRFIGMVWDIIRFYKSAPKLLRDPAMTNLSLGDFLVKGGYSQAFINDHILPMAAAIWSCSTSTMRAFPLSSFVRFFVNHGLLELTNRPQWWTVDGGSREYVTRLRAELPGRFHIGRRVVAVRRRDGCVIVTDAGGCDQIYDTVVMACHGDQSFELVADKTDREATILSGFTYQPNTAILHSDVDQMPRTERIWSSWNYLADRRNGDAEESRVAVTYWMNRLQTIDPSSPLFVTLNPVTPVAEEKVISTFGYEHPVFDGAAIESQRRLPEIQGQGGLWYCGSYCGYGFHEDGLSSAVAVARRLGVDAPWGHRPHPAMQAVGPETDRQEILFRKAA